MPAIAKTIAGGERQAWADETGSGVANAGFTALRLPVDWKAAGKRKPPQGRPRCVGGEHDCFVSCRDWSEPSRTVNGRLEQTKRKMDIQRRASGESTGSSSLPTSGQKKAASRAANSASERTQCLCLMSGLVQTIAGGERQQSPDVAQAEACIDRLHRMEVDIVLTGRLVLEP